MFKEKKVEPFKFSELKRVKLGFPSEWVLGEMRIHYRYGRVTIFVKEESYLKTEKYWDTLDLGGYMTDEDLKKILVHHKLLVDQV
jgi:hypothetical protein